MSEEVLKTGSVILKDPAAEEALTSEWEDGQGKLLEKGRFAQNRGRGRAPV